MKPWSDWSGIGKRKKGKMKGRKRKRGKQKFESNYLCTSTTPFDTRFSSCLHSSLSLPPLRLAHKSLHPLNSFSNSDDYTACYSLVGVQTGEEKKTTKKRKVLRWCGVASDSGETLTLITVKKLINAFKGLSDAKTLCSGLEYPDKNSQLETLSQ